MERESVPQPRFQESQTCTTHDGVTVSFQTVAFFSIENGKSFLIDNDDSEEILDGMILSTAADIVVQHSFEFFVSPRFRSLLKKRLSKQQHRIGVSVKKIGLMNQYRYDRTYLTRG